MAIRDAQQNKEETITDGMPVIETNHANIHNRIAYELSGTIDILAAGVAGIELTVPSNAYVHFQTAELAANGGPVIVSFLEDYSFVEAAASVLVPVNLHRLYPKTSVITVRSFAAITAVAGPDAATVRTLFIPGATQGSQRLGASSSNTNELVLARKKYLLTMTNSAGSTTKVGYYLFWYEETAA